MGLFRTRTTAVFGIDAHLIDVEVDLYQSGSARDFIVTPANHKCLVFFITNEKQESLTQYASYFEDDILHIEGETNHASDHRIVNAQAAG